MLIIVRLLRLPLPIGLVLGAIPEYSPLYVHYPECYSGIPCLYTIHFTPLTKNHPKSDFYLLNSKKCITFAPESPTPGFRGREVSPLGKPIYLTKHPSRGFQDIFKRRLLALCSDTLKLRNFQNPIRAVQR